uniref:Uncharacterized protein n=1 Tax=Anguilla anguilla TaxID=7936 RepID=A0A0E9Q337_ANGAN
MSQPAFQPFNRRPKSNHF